MSERLDAEPYKSLRAYPQEDQLFIGGLKNLLCGATTVAHHDPPHKALWRKDFPVRVLRDYGWSHSLHFDTGAEVVRSYRDTPANWPWFIHLAEGTDQIAAAEYQRLKTLGCVGPKTVIVHGVGMSDADVIDALHNTRGLAWCPSTNLYLLDKAEDIFHRRVLSTLPERPAHCAVTALGSDSRLTADSDLLGEMHVAARIRAAFLKKRVPDRDYGGNPRLFDDIVRLVTEAAAELLGLVDCGHLRAGAVADFIAVSGTEKGAAALCEGRRSSLALVVKGGVPQIGNPDVMALFPNLQTVPATLDGIPKAIHIDLARRIEKCSLKEAGLEMETGGSRRRSWFVRH